ncbi:MULTISPECIES: response regulator [Agrobacterium]|uniref:response regulator n=1 Tax=Agrobacterium TaxID=357 RepID=UPI0018AF9FE5|nr:MULTISPECIES: response regulator [Agrobacterium]
MDQILLWSFNLSDRSMHWQMPNRGIEGIDLLDYLGVTEPEPVIETGDGFGAIKIGALLSSAYTRRHFSGKILTWSGQHIFDGAVIIGCLDGNMASGAVHYKAPAGTHLNDPIASHPIYAGDPDKPEPSGDQIATLEKAQQTDPNFTRVLIEAIEALPEAFVLYGPDDRMVVCNEQYRRLYPTVADMMAPGLSFHDVMRESLRRGVFQLNEDAEQWSRKRLSFHHANIGFFEQHLSDGRWIQVSERKTPSGAISSIRADITILKEREADLRAALDEAKNELAARTRFVAKVGHELRNPLNIVYNIAQLLKDERGSASQQQTFDTLFGAASAMRDVLGDFLDVTSLRSGQFNIDTRPTDTRALLREIVDFARLMGRQSMVSFRSHTARDIPRQVLTDPRRIRQIMFNLLGNAFKYAPGGSVVLDTFTLEVDDLPVLRVSVTDTGKGIGGELGAQLFTPYTRNREHRLSGIEGLGLGLAISEELAAALGVSLGVAPVVEGGTQAWIDIPIVSADRLVQSAPRGSEPPVSTGIGPTMDVLVIDDEPANLIVAESVLKRLGHKVMTAQTGQHALFLLTEHNFDAALLDISMPEMSGVELAHAIIAGGFASNGMGIIAMTGNVMPNDIRHYFDAGITGFVEKPVDIQSLAEALSAVRKGGGGQSSLEPQERVRFSRREKTSTFDRGGLDRMLEDIGHENVMAIVSSSVVTMQAALAIVKRGSFSTDELYRALHKVESVAGLLGFEQLARSTHTETPTASPGSLQLAELREELASAIMQLKSYTGELGSEPISR